MNITAICVTFARVKHLENALACFLAQECSAETHLVIYNTCTAQRLQYGHPKVTVINAQKRPETIGQTRNEAIRHAKDGLIVHWDDDDGYGVRHLENFLTGFDPSQHDWCWQDKQFYMEGDKIKGVVKGSANVWAYTKKAWTEAGGFNAINCGEDRDFLARVTSKFKGIQVALANNQISFYYRWGQGDTVHHLSGLGDDKPGEPTGMQRSGAFAEERLGALMEPQGSIELLPKFDFDYGQRGMTFTNGVSTLLNQRRGKIGIIQCGHAGDIFNCLPIAKHIHDRGGVRPMWFVNTSFAPVLEGVSYVDPVPLDIKEEDVLDVIKFAQQRCEITLVPQVYGNNYPATHDTKCFNTEGWRMCGMLAHFEDKVNFPLVIDQRDAKRELKLVSDYVKTGKPMLLANLTGGFSSPYSAGVKVLEYLRWKWGKKFNVVDIASIKAERICDMLGLFDAAVLLVSSDTYSLHLAVASKVPVVAILNNQGDKWLRTRCRCNCVLELEYLDAMKRLDEIDKVIEGL